MTEPPAAPPADPKAEFAALMSAAGEAAAGPPDEAPYGYTRDRATGETRPKKSPGRGGVKPPPGVEELKAAAAGDSPPAAVPADRPPARPGRRPSGPRAPRPEVPYHPGQITRGMNRLYRQAGKITRAMDADLGTAIIEAARNTAEDGDPDDSVGAAWDEVARVNPRIRRFCVMLVSGGAYGRLVMAHAPVLLAVMMKPAVADRIPFSRFVKSMAEPDEDTAEGDGGLPGGLTFSDVQQMAAMADQFAGQMGVPVPPEVAEAMQAAAAAGGNGAPPPRAAPRNQPRRHRRAS